MQKTSLWLTALLLFTGNLLTASDTERCTCKEPEFTLAVAIGITVMGAAGAGILLAAPYLIAALPSAAAIKAAALGAGTKVASMSTVGKVGLGFTAAQLARPLVLKTTEEKLDKLLKEEAYMPVKAKTEFIECLKSNRKQSRNRSGVPVACEEAALFYALNSSVPELNRRTEAFKSNKCFCSDHL